MIATKTIEQILFQKTIASAPLQRLFKEMGCGRIGPDDAEKILLLLGKRGIGADEILCAVRTFKNLSVNFRRPRECIDAMDMCGTGGDGKNTFNISTVASFVVAGSGIPVAKHGNRGVSSVCGSADLLEALGLNIEASTGQMLYALRETHFGYFHAPLYHRAMRKVLPVRQRLKTKTIFNILGPLLNPLNVRRHLIGVFHASLLYPMAEVLNRLKSERAVLVHGRDGLDEVSTTARTDVVVLDRGRIESLRFDAQRLGIQRVSLNMLKGGTVAERARETLAILGGSGRTALRDAVLVNAAFGIWAFDRTVDLKTCLKRAESALRSGAAMNVLNRLRELTHV